MHPNELVDEFRRGFKPSDCSEIVLSLPVNSLAWYSLLRGDFFHRALEKFGNQVQLWTPGNLALLEMGDELTASDLKSLPLIPLSSSLRQRSVLHYEKMLQIPTIPDTLSDAGLIALALRERRRLTCTWSGLADELLRSNTSSSTKDEAWNYALSCLFGIIPDPVELLRNLLHAGKKLEGMNWVLYCLSSNPLSDLERGEILYSLISDQSMKFQLYGLRRLSNKGYFRIAEIVARKLISDIPLTKLKIADHDQFSENGDLPSRVEEQIYYYTLFRLAGNQQKALDYLRSGMGLLKYWMGGLSIEGLSVDKAFDETVNLVEEIDQSSVLKSGFSSILSRLDKREVYLETIHDQPSDPFFQIRKAEYLFQQGDVWIAKEIASQAIPGLLMATLDHRKSSDFIFEQNLADFIKIFDLIGLTGDAESLAQAILKENPQQFDVISALCEIYIKNRKLPAAIGLANQLSAAFPDDPDSHRRLANLYETTAQYSQALVERQLVVDFQKEPNKDDLLALGKCALEIGRYDLAKEICQKILLSNEDDGEAIFLLGLVKVNLGDYQAALIDLDKASKIISEQENVWLELAHLYSMMDNPNRACETLQAGSFAIPTSAKILLARAEYSIDSGKLTEALPYLYKALDLGQNIKEIPQKLGFTLECLGHHEEAERVLSEARLNWPSDPGLAYEHARSLYSLADYEKALDTLEIALKDSNSELNWGLLYARILVGENETADVQVSLNRIVTAEKVIHSILAKSPDLLEPNILLGEVLFLKDELQAAFQVFYKLAENETNRENQLAWRIYWGLGKAAFTLGKMDTAIAALLEASQIRPSSVPIHQLLAESYLNSGLSDEAVEKAGIAIQLAPDDLPVLEWYALLMSKMEREEDAVKALRCAVDLRPDRGDLWVRLAQMQVKLGDVDGARISLAEVVRLDSPHPDDLRRAADTYMRLQEMNLALGCLERALEIEEAPTDDLLIETANLYKLVGNPSRALETVEKILATRSDHIPALVNKSECLEQLERDEESRHSLQEALRLVEKQISLDNETKLKVEFSPSNEIPTSISQALVGDIHHGLSRLNYRLGDYKSAYQHALIALDLKPFDLELRYLGAALSHSMLHFTKVSEILAPLAKLDRLSSWTTSQMLNGEKIKLALHGIRAEMALESGDLINAGFFINSGLALLKDERLICIQICHMMAKKDRVSANLMYQSEIEPVVRGLISDQTIENQSLQRNIFLRDRLIWLAMSALSLEKWEESLALVDIHISLFPGDPLGYYEKMRVLYQMGEIQDLANNLQITRHSPLVEFNSPGYIEKFTKAYEASKAILSSPLIESLKMRGDALFLHTNEAVMGLSSVATKDPTLAAAYILALRINSEIVDITELIQQYFTSVEVIKQGALYYKDHYPEEGFCLSKSLVEMDPEQPIHQAILALLAQETGDLVTSLKALNTALVFWPDEEAWQIWAGKLTAALGDTEGAVQCWEKALNLDPTNVQIKLALGQAYLDNRDFTKAVARLREVVDVNPKQSDAWSYLTKAYRMIGRLEDASSASMKLIELEPGGSKGQFQFAEISLAQGDFAKALTYSEQGLKNNPRDVDLAIFTNSLYKQKGLFDKALSVIEQSIQMVPDALVLRIEKGKILKELQGIPQAIDYLKEISIQHPDDPGLLHEIAKLYEDQGDYRSAERAALSAVRIDISNPDLHSMMGRLERKFGQLDQAVYYLSEAIKINPKNIDPYLELGAVYQDRREHIQAIKIFQQAIKADPGDYRPYYQAALLLREAKDYSGAEMMLRRAAELSPEDLNIRRQLGAVIALNLVFNAQEVGV